MLTDDEALEANSLLIRKTYAFLYPDKLKQLTPEEVTRLEELTAKCPTMQRHKREYDDYIAKKKH
jgi:hypothetical protein